MHPIRRAQNPCRRDVLKWWSAGALALAVPGGRMNAAEARGAKPLRGIFPIAQTPFTESDKVDLEALAAEVKFIDRGRVHGFVWPQNWSEWRTLTEQERLDGAEAILAAGKGLRTAIVIGVQAPDLPAAVKYARHAEKLGADAIISLPPGQNSDARTVLEYYQELGKATALPLFSQAVGNIAADTLLEMYRTIPTLRHVKDEAAGNRLERIGLLREKSSDQLKLFSGFGGRTLIDEMRRGSSGSMPDASLADLFAQTWDLWHEGKRKEAMDMHARTLLCVAEVDAQAPPGPPTPESAKYILCERGVFKSWRTRQAPGQKAPPTHSGPDEAGMRALREALAYVKPYLKA